MQQRLGTENVGMQYQYKVITYVAASLLNNDDVEDFVIFTNLEDIPGFDDLVVKVWFKTRKKPHIFFGQIKHKKKKIDFIKEKYKLRNYEEFAKKIIEMKNKTSLKTLFANVPNKNLEFWIYSNNFVSNTDDTYRIERDDNYKPIIQSKQCGECFKLIPIKSTFSQNFLQSFHLFLNQPNNSEIYSDIQNLLRFSKESTEKLINYVEKILRIDGLTKTIFETEAMYIHLSDIIVKSTTAIEMDIEQARIWNNITLHHDVTLIDSIFGIEHSLYGCLLQQINVIYDCNFSWNDCVYNKGILEGYFDVQNFVNSSSQDTRHYLTPPDTIDALIKEMWKLGKLPLLLKYIGDISVLEKYKHLKKKFIIIGDVTKVRNELGSCYPNIFTDISNIGSLKLKDDLLNQIVVSLQGRNLATLNDIISGSEICMKQLTCCHILDLIKKRTIFINQDCLKETFDETEFMIFIVIDDANTESFNIDERKIVIRCKHHVIDNCKKQLEKEVEFESDKIHILQQIDCKLKYMGNSILKLRNFIEDQDSQSIYVSDKLEPFPLIGENLGVKPKEYIKRHLSKAIINTKFFDETEKLICLICGNTDSLTSNIKGIIERNTNFNLENFSEVNETIIVTVPEEALEEHWKSLYSNNDKLILLKAIDGCLELIKYKNIPNISEYISYGQQSFTQDDFFNQITNNLVVISGDPGMGKSYSLHKLAEMCDKQNYVLFFNLSDYRMDFKEVTKELFEDPLRYLFMKKKSYKFQDFIENVYITHKNDGRLTVFLDSFDEILPFYEKTVLMLLESIIKLNIKVIISSRLISDGILVKKFEVQLLRLNPIEKSDLSLYLTSINQRFWNLEEIPYMFLNNPLYFKFLIFLCQLDPVDFSRMKEIDLYRMFIEKIIERYCQKYRKDYNPDITSFREQLLKNYRLLALVVIFGKEILQEQGIITNYDDLENEFKCEDIKLGIVKYFNEGYPIFIHQTIAELMAMEWLNINLSKGHPSAKFMCKKVYFESSLNVRYIFDSITCNEFILHKAVLDSDLKTVKRLCKKQKDALTQADEWGRTALHLASSYCLLVAEKKKYRIIEIIVKNMIKRKCNLDAKDKILDWTWLDFLNNKNIDVTDVACDYFLPSVLDIYLAGREARKLFEFACSLEFHYTQRLNFYFQSGSIGNKQLYKKLHSMVNFLMTGRRLDIICHIMERYGNANLPMMLKLPSLHRASLENSESKIISFLQVNIDANERDMFGRIPLHYSAVHGSVGIVTKLLDRTSNVNIKDNEGNTPLHFASRFRNDNAIRLLLEKGANTKERNIYGQTASNFAKTKWTKTIEDTNKIEFRIIY